MPQSPTGLLIRRWRTARGLSQMALAHTAEISPRQLSFIETGRGRPTRTTLERLAEALSITRHDRALLMQSAGVTPASDLGKDRAYAESLDRALVFLLEQHEPNPAWVIDQYTNLHMQNRAMGRLLPLLLSPDFTSHNGTLNLIRMLFDPSGIRLRLSNWEALARTAVQRLELAVAADPQDTAMRALRDDVLASHPGATEWTRRDESAPLDLIVPLTLRTNGPDLHLATAFTMLATADGMTIKEYCIQNFFPLDEMTRTFLTAMASNDEATPRPS